MLRFWGAAPNSLSQTTEARSASAHQVAVPNPGFGIRELLAADRNDRRKNDESDQDRKFVIRISHGYATLDEDLGIHRPTVCKYSSYDSPNFRLNAGSS